MWLDNHVHFRLRLEWKVQDMWIGVSWQKLKAPGLRARSYDVWVCLLPCLPLHLSWQRVAEEVPNWLQGQR